MAMGPRAVIPLAGLITARFAECPDPEANPVAVYGISGGYPPEHRQK
jgi:hypothetical protein